MTALNKAKNKVEKAKGQAREAVGKAVGNDRMRVKGKGQQLKAGAKQTAEKVKDAVKR